MQGLATGVGDLKKVLTNVKSRGTWGEVQLGAILEQILSPEQYRGFSLPYISQICDAINEAPITVFAKGAFFAREEIGQTACNVVGLDWNMDISESRKLIPNKTLQGNLDPCVLYAPMAEVEKHTKTMLSAFGKQKYIANLGHGVYPDTDPEKVKCFIETVKAF